MTCYDFAAPDADIILVSSDPVPAEFRVHKFILSAASPFFHDMLALPQPKVSSFEIPTIPLSETRETIDTLLRFIYPVPDPLIISLEELTPILAASIKYDFPIVTDALRQVLVSSEFLRSEPIRVFVLATRFDLRREARLASHHTLNTRLLDIPPCEDLMHISAYAYHELLSLHLRHAKALHEIVDRPAKDIKCVQCNGSLSTTDAEPKWWIEFKKRAKVALAERPTGEGILDMPFLAKCAIASGCQRCPGSVLDAHMFLNDLKKEIEALPTTI